MGRCMPGDTCVFIESGRQIDRFFRLNPAYAEQYLHDNFWEHRAIAVRYAPQKALVELINDVDEVVRRAVTYHIPQTQLIHLIGDPDREVRMTVADRIAPEDLEKLANDPDYIVRLTVARRLPTGRLFRLIRDKDMQVRKLVAERLPEVSLGLMADDDGSYMLTHPENAAQLKTLKQQIITATSADMVVSSNFGCALFLADESIKVEHPLLLLSRQLYKAALN